jgi:hypothetical protein
MFAVKALGVAVAVVLSLAGLLAVASRSMNAGVARDLREHPDGERARKVMLLTLPSGKTFPVHYLREGQTVYAGADFPWWRELRGPGGAVRILIQGKSYEGHGRAVEDDAPLRASVFARLRPNAPSWAGTLVEIVICADGDCRGRGRGEV